MKVEELPIPEPLREFIIRRRGVTELYPPQEEAVRAGILNGENILWVSSTASGKTLLAEVAAVNNVLSRDGKTIVAVPLKALAYEKYRDFELYGDLGVRTAVSTGDYSSEDRWLGSYDIVVTTYEKLDSLLRLKPTWLSSVNQLIIDEIHYLGDPERGPIIESIVAKVRSLGLKVQFIGLSATVGNPEELAGWLDARLVKSNWRPVELREGVYYRGVIRYSNGVERRIEQRFNDPVVDLAIDTLINGGQALVFSSSRQLAVKYAKKISQAICSLTIRLIDPAALEKVSEDIRENSSSRIIADELSSTVKCGVAFHHAGLEPEVRRIIEDGFRAGVLRVVSSTTTLAAGVNLPARRVILSQYRRYEPEIGRYMEIPVMEYKQMAGRAGRPGLDPYGEAVTIVDSEDEALEFIEGYIKSPPEDVKSSFINEPTLKFHILSALASGYASTIDDLASFISNTLAAHQYDLFSNEIQRGATIRLIERVLNQLSAYGFIKESDGRFEATELGMVVNRMYLDPDTAHIYVKGLREVRQGIDLEQYALVLVVKSPKVPRVKVRRNEVDELAREVALNWGNIPLTPTDDIDEFLNYPEDYMDLLEEYKTAKALLMWINEYDEDTILRSLNVEPGDLRAITEQAEWLTSSLAELARVVKPEQWLIDYLRALTYRVRYGVRPELLELVVNIEGVGRVRARALYNAGYRTIEDLAKASPMALRGIRGIGDRLAQSIVEQARSLVQAGKVVKFQGVQDRGMRRRGSILDYY